MAETFIPDLWSARILDQLDKFLVAEPICNNFWEGEIKRAGDSVKIWTPGDITVKSYTKDSDHAAADATTGTDDSLLINQQKYFNFQVDVITQAQMPVAVLNAYMDRAIYAMRDNIDAYVLGLYTGVAAANTVTPSATLTSSNIYTELLKLYRVMTDAKVPLEGRYLVVSPRVLEQINSYLGARSTVLGDNVAVNGYVGKFAGFNVYLSHNVVETDEDMTGTSSTETVHNCLAGTNIGITLAKQIPLGSLKMYEPELRFATAVKGLMVYGAKMLYSGAANGLLKAWFSN
jgi:predicted small secreted protein